MNDLRYQIVIITSMKSPTVKALETDIKSFKRNKENKKIYAILDRDTGKLINEVEKKK